MRHRIRDSDFFAKMYVNQRIFLFVNRLTTFTSPRSTLNRDLTRFSALLLARSAHLQTNRFAATFYTQGRNKNAFNIRKSSQKTGELKRDKVRDVTIIRRTEPTTTGGESKKKRRVSLIFLAPSSTSLIILTN